MIRADDAIARCRRDLRVGSMLKTTLLTAALLFLVLGVGLEVGGAAMLVGVGLIWFVWMVLNFRSIQASRLAASSPSLIASGDFDGAERQIGQAIRSFSLFRMAKLMTLHHLALLRHAQRRWQEAAALSREVLLHRLSQQAGLSTRSRLVLADALLELGDMYGAWDAIMGLYRQRISLAEALNLAAVQLDYQSRVGQWEAIVSGVGAKVQLANLMPAPMSARVQAMLALAARKSGRTPLYQWLRRRVELLADPAELCAERPILREVWSE